jgi:hypothetical protein
MSHSNSAKASARAARRQREFDGQCCLVCRITDAVMLVATPRGKVPRRFLEQHHVVGQVNDADATIPLCRNHHALATAAYMEAGAEMEEQPTLLHKIEMVLRSLGAYSQIMGVSFPRWADDLAELIEGLDEEYPDWRDIDVGEDD